MTYITRIDNKTILAKYFLYSLQIYYLLSKLSASRLIFSCYATYGYVRLCMVIYGYLFLSTVMYGYVVLLMVMYGYLW